MNTKLFQVCCLVGLLTAPIWTLAGCGREVATSEKTKTDSNGNKVEEKTTVTRNPDGTETVDKSKTETKQP